MRSPLWILALAAVVGVCAPARAAPDKPAPVKPTIVLVHGAFADLQRDGYSVVAAANPLRSIAGDAAYVASVVKSVDGPVVLVAHSYGGAVISQAGAETGTVKALVFVSAFAP